MNIQELEIKNQELHEMLIDLEHDRFHLVNEFMHELSNGRSY